MINDYHLSLKTRSCQIPSRSIVSMLSCPLTLGHRPKARVTKSFNESYGKSTPKSHIDNEVKKSFWSFVQVLSFIPSNILIYILCIFSRSKFNYTIYWLYFMQSLLYVSTIIGNGRLPLCQNQFSLPSSFAFGQFLGLL
jgi:hypothetical protein